MTTSLDYFFEKYNIRTLKTGKVCLNDLSNLVFPKGIYDCEDTYYISSDMLRIFAKMNNKNKYVNELYEIISELKGDFLKKEYIYVISTSLTRPKNIYKIGKSTKTYNQLLGRYITYFMDPVIVFSIHVSDCSYIEDKILKHLDKYRLININNNKSEWVEMDLENLIYNIKKIYNKYEVKNNIECIYSKKNKRKYFRKFRKKLYSI